MLSLPMSLRVCVCDPHEWLKVWLLKNLAYKADLELKQSILTHLSPALATTLINDASSVELMEQVLRYGR